MSTDNLAKDAVATQPRSYCWLPTMKLEPDMVLARPVVGGSQSRGAIQLAAGGHLTASTIAQLINKGIECVAVVLATPPAAEAHALAVAQHEARLHEIFGSTPNADCQPLLNALLADGPDPC